MYGLIILAVYALIMIGVTLLLTKKENTALKFHVGDRDIGTFAAALSIAATWIWAPSLFTASEKAYTSGLPGLFWFLVPNVLCLIIFIPFAKKIRRLFPQGITLAGYIGKRYNSKRAKGVYMFQMSALSVLSTGVQLLAGSKLLSSVTGVPFWAMTIILAVIAYSYSQFSGIKASVTTDIIQMLLILLTLGLIVPWLIKSAGDISVIVDGLSGIYGGYGSLFSKSGLEVFLGFGLPTAIGLLSGPFGDQSFWQRAFSIKEKSVGKAFFFGALIFGLVPFGMGLLGYIAAGNGFIAVDSSMVNFEFITAMLPGWVVIPFLLMIISGLLSTVDSNLCAAASMTTDLKTVSERSDGEQLKFSRGTMIALLCVSVLIANIPGLTVTHLFLFYGTLRASTLLPTVITLTDKIKLTGNGVFAGVLCALTIGLPIFAYGNIANIAMYKTLGSLTTVLLSGIISVVVSSRKREAVST